MKEYTTVVAIGAGTGGLEAITQFFKPVPQYTDVIFIVYQNGVGDYVTRIQEVLYHHTKLEVSIVEEGMAVVPNKIYVIPTGMKISIVEGCFAVEAQYDIIPNNMIDNLFETLTHTKKDKMIGIILSGIGEDGAKGVKYIHDAGGIVMVQNESSAEFLGMPKAAVETGVVDFVVEPSAMIEIILERINKHTIPIELLNDKDKETAFHEIIAIIKEHTNVDFFNYKKSTIVRRIERRMAILDIELIDTYLLYIQENEQEIYYLYNEIFIGVTNFFRDKEAFDTLNEKVIPNLFKDKKEGDMVRIWVAGCSTGEEVYSLLMLCEEYQEYIGKTYQIKIFGTDLDKKALDHASKGMYSEESMMYVSEERRRKFFNKKSGYYQINKYLRDKVLFTKHNLIKDAPFSKLDLITCRNLLIYLEASIQQSILSFFHFSLNHTGYLFLGSSETIGDMYKYFEVVDAKWKIYKYAGYVKMPKVNTFDIRGFDEYKQQQKGKVEVRNRKTEYTIDQSVDRVLESLQVMYIPKGIVLNEEYEILHAIGDVNKYVKIPFSRITLNIMQMIRKDLYIPVGTAIHSAIKEDKKFKYNDIYIEENGMYQRIVLTTIPFVDQYTSEKYIVLLFEEENISESAYEQENFRTYNKVYEHIADLEHELRFNQKHLKSVIEELEVSNKELISANEEFQNTNEELQSVNEELYTVNSEYHMKIEELTQAQNDITNILGMIDMNMIFLDTNLTIRKFTTGIKRIINLIKEDEGRPFTDIALNIQYNDLLKVIGHVVDTLKQEVIITRDSTGESILKITVAPYFNEEEIHQGIILSFLDISDIEGHQCVGRVSGEY